MLFRSLLKSMIRQGTLRLITAEGKTYAYGNGTAPQATIKLHKKNLEWTLALYPQLSVGEAYMNGLLTIEEGTLRNFLHIVLLNYHRLTFPVYLEKLFRWAKAVFRIFDSNPLRQAWRDVSSHYDLSPKLYDLFLDLDRQYSCAYFEGPNVNLEQAQEDKKLHIAAKLRLKHDQKILDVGSGWGGMALYLARETGCDVTGITLSEAQLASSNKRVQSSGLAKHCRFALRDYREEKGLYDRIVSVGMFEHVGERNYGTFFAKVRDLLTDDGVCLLHSIGRFESGTASNPFIRKYIFPGAEIPSLSTAIKAIEKAGLFVTDVEILRLHYAETLRRWEERFQKHRVEIAGIYDERFCRMWEFYLIGCEMSFRVGDLMVFQVQIAKNLNSLPITRNYMHEWEEMAKGLPTPSAAQKHA